MFPFRCITVLPYCFTSVIQTRLVSLSKKKGLMATSVLTLDQKNRTNLTCKSLSSSEQSKKK